MRKAVKTLCTRVRTAESVGDGDQLAVLLASDGGVAPGLQDVTAASGLRSLCASHLEEDWAEVTAGAAVARAAGARGEQVQAFNAYSSAYTAFLRLFGGSDGNWLLPTLHSMTYCLRTLAASADDELAASGVTGDKLRECDQAIKRAFSLTCNDRGPLESSKKWGALYIVVQLFKVYFRLNTLRLCKNLIRAVEGPGFPAFDAFPLSEQVAYKFYVGRLSMFEDQYAKAEVELLFAFTACTAASRKNKRLALQYLIPARMVQGVLPQEALLEEYDLPQFSAIALAVRRGDLRMFTAALEEQQDFFIRRGIYLILEKLKTLVFRSLLRRIAAIAGDSKLDIAQVEAALTWMGADMDRDEVECVLANLIYKGYVKGYIAHAHGKLVVSKKNPFPRLSSVKGGLM